MRVQQFHQFRLRPDAQVLADRGQVVGHRAISQAKTFGNALDVGLRQELHKYITFARLQTFENLRGNPAIPIRFPAGRIIYRVHESHANPPFRVEQTVKYRNRIRAAAHTDVPIYIIEIRAQIRTWKIRKRGGFRAACGGSH